MIGQDNKLAASTRPPAHYEPVVPRVEQKSKPKPKVYTPDLFNPDGCRGNWIFPESERRSRKTKTKE